MTGSHFSDVWVRSAQELTATRSRVVPLTIVTLSVWANTHIYFYLWL